MCVCVCECECECEREGASVCACGERVRGASCRRESFHVVAARAKKGGREEQNKNPKRGDQRGALSSKINVVLLF